MTDWFIDWFIGLLCFSARFVFVLERMWWYPWHVARRLPISRPYQPQRREGSLVQPAVVVQEAVPSSGRRSGEGWAGCLERLRCTLLLCYFCTTINLSFTSSVRSDLSKEGRIPDRMRWGTCQSTSEWIRTIWTNEDKFPQVLPILRILLCLRDHRVSRHQSTPGTIAVGSV